MLHYIINTSIIWLACLLLYELLLRKESFHQYNRIYLLVSLVAGLLLPTVNLNGITTVNSSSLIQPTGQVYEIKKAMIVKQIQEISNPIASSDNHIGYILWTIYLLGIFAGILLMVWEVIGLFRLYFSGSKSSELGCLIVETGKDHCPFSIFNMVFIRNRQDYNQAQWNLLIAHEKEHSRQCHLADNLLLILLRIVCWFHPLPHIYYKRLRIVHEFQADRAAASNTIDYGTFLLEQNLLQGAPILAHSFIYSPIKTRIAMLTRTRSTPAQLLKYLTIFPLSLILIIFCTQSTFSKGISKKGKKAYFKGNEIEFGELKVIPFEFREKIQQQKKIFLYTSLPDSVPVKNWATDEIKMQPVLSDTMPVAMNGKPIFGSEPQYMLSDVEPKYIAPVLIGSGKNFDEYLFSKLKKELDQLEDGAYIFHLNCLVIDDQGNVAYYQHPGIDVFMGPDERKPLISDGIRQQIEQKFVEVLDGSIRFKPALKDGKPVNVRLNFGNYQIVIKDHKAQLVERGGC